jgi:hypothetical protein
MKRTRIVLLGLAAVLASGCATQFTGSAPADADHIYVSGAKQQILAPWVPAIWRCPANSPGECEEVNVSD